LIAGMMFLNMSALMFGAGAITAGFRSKDSGNCFWDGVGDFIRNEWAMQVAISSTLVIATFGLSLAAKGMIGAAGGLAKLIGKGIGKKAKALPNTKIRGRAPGKTIDLRTGEEVGRFISDGKGNTMIEPVGGKAVAAGKNGIDTHTLFPNGSNYQRLNPAGHFRNPTAHGHGHLIGAGPGMKGQGVSIDPLGNIVPWDSAAGS
ncbi:MAG: hypothetical protein FWE13_01600, partial [Firmicutes bacterium]|nr:hypothetical protein [Bacillota bacterium]